MDLNEAKKLKEEGDNAKVEGNLQDALNRYADAYHLAKVVFDTTLADILASTAEIKLEQKDFQLALEAANDSVNYDPKLVKALFVRASALDKLGHKTEATGDLRRILEIDPVNTTARKFLRGIAPPVKMVYNFRDAYIGHYMRRHLYKSCDTDQESKTAYWRSLKNPLLRISFLSSKTSHGVRLILVGASVIEDQSMNGGIVKLKLPSWFVLKHLKYKGNYSAVVNVLLSRKATLLLLQVVKTGGITLMFSTESFANDFLNGYKFSYVIYKDEKSIMAEEPAQAGVELLKKVSKSLTRLPCLAEVSSFDEPKFPRLYTVIMGSQFSIDFKFLKAWYEYIWPTKQIVFSEPMENSTVFKHFKKVAISETVVKGHFSLGHDTLDLKNNLNGLSEHFKTLKKVFPNLHELVGILTFDFTGGKNLSDVSIQLKNCLQFFAAQINKKIKPLWCPKLKILIKMECELEVIKEMDLNAGPLIKAVDDCKKDIKNTKWVRLNGPSAIDFDWTPNNCCHAMVEASTDDAAIQVAFTSPQ